MPSFTTSPDAPPVMAAPRSHDAALAFDMLDTTALKGLAITAIVLHNFFHVVSPAHQNEFTFQAHRFDVFLQTVSQPALAIQAFFSSFGHFGVQVFIFLSAYGLTRSHWNDTSWTAFMRSRVRKLYPAVVLIVLPWCLIVAAQIGPAVLLKRWGLQLVLMVTGLSPFLPGAGLPPVGPWWFIPFILEFYALFFLLRAAARKFGWRGLVAIAAGCMGLTLVVNPYLAPWSINLLTTPLGRMPTICLGIAAALYPIRIHAPLAMAGLAVLLLGSRYAALWPFTAIAALVVMLWGYLLTRRVMRGSRIVQILGRYSLCIFLLNAIVRNVFVPMTTTPASQLYFGCLSALVSVGLSIVIQKYLVPRDRTQTVVAP